MHTVADAFDTALEEMTEARQYEMDRQRPGSVGCLPLTLKPVSLDEREKDQNQCKEGSGSAATCLDATTPVFPTVRLRSVLCEAIENPSTHTQPPRRPLSLPPRLSVDSIRG